MPRDRLPPRDARGRFCKRPTPTLIDPAVLKTLGQGRRAVEMTQPFDIVVTERRYYHTPDIDEPAQEA